MALALTPKESILLEHDPHGIILAVTCILFVFAVLLILYCVYGLSGEYFIRRQRKDTAMAQSPDGTAPRSGGDTVPRSGNGTTQRGGADMDGTEELGLAIAIAMALEVQARAGLDEGHDKESGVITIRHDIYSKWTRI